MLVNQTTVGTVCHHFDSCLTLLGASCGENSSSNASCARSQTIMCATGLILAVVLIVEVWNVGEYGMCIDTPLYCTCCFWLRGARNIECRGRISMLCHRYHVILVILAQPTSVLLLMLWLESGLLAVCIFTRILPLVQQESLTRVLVWMLSEITSLIVLVLLLVIYVRLACPGNPAKILLLHTNIRREFKNINVE